MQPAILKRESKTHGVMGMLDFWRDPSADEEPGAAKRLVGEEDAPFWLPSADFAEFARRSLRNCSLFMVGSAALSLGRKCTRKAKELRGAARCRCRCCVIIHEPCA